MGDTFSRDSLIPTKFLSSSNSISIGESNEKFFGFSNVANTCYINSVLQALFYCIPFRHKVLEYKPKDSNIENLLTTLSDLFRQIQEHKNKQGTIGPKKFVSQLKKEYPVFDNFNQQDAQEMLNFLLNRISEILQSELLEEGSEESGSNCSSQRDMQQLTWVQEIFQGTLTNETKCLTCERVKSKDETFLDISVDIEQNTSITSCLNDFSSSETLTGNFKYYCDDCGGKQEATKRLRIKHFPAAFALHLKRFKFDEKLMRHTKLSYRIVFPKEMGLTSSIDTDKMYDLFAVVVHCGQSPNQGHYYTMVKTPPGFWLQFDDDRITQIDPNINFEGCYGRSSERQKGSDQCGYLLFYQERTINKQLIDAKDKPPISSGVSTNTESNDDNNNNNDNNDNDNDNNNNNNNNNNNTNNSNNNNSNNIIDNKNSKNSNSNTASKSTTNSIKNKIKINTKK